MDSSLKYRKLDGVDNAEHTDVSSESLACFTRRSARPEWFGFAGMSILKAGMWISSSGVGKTQQRGPNPLLNQTRSLLWS